MPQIGPLEILVVAAVALIVFGPEKLPDLARKVGRTATELRRIANEAKAEFQTDFSVDDDDDEHARSSRASTGRRTTRPRQASADSEAGEQAVSHPEPSADTEQATPAPAEPVQPPSGDAGVAHKGDGHPEAARKEG